MFNFFYFKHRDYFYLNQSSLALINFLLLLLINCLLELLNYKYQTILYCEKSQIYFILIKILKTSMSQPLEDY